MDKFLKQKREHDVSGSHKHNESNSNKRVKTRSIRKYNESLVMQEASDAHSKTADSDTVSVGHQLH